MSNFVSAESFCVTCDEPVSVSYYCSRHRVRVHHSPPLCSAAYSLLCHESDGAFFRASENDSGWTASPKDDRWQDDAAHLAASAQFLVGWDLLGFLLAKSDEINDA